MPSRKKAQGQARKAKQAPKYGCPSCDHFHLKGVCLQEDYDECKKHVSAYEEKVNSRHSPDIVSIRICHEKYIKLNNCTKKLFREIVLSKLTACILRDANKAPNVLEYQPCASTLHYIQLFIMIEVLDKNDPRIVSKAILEPEKEASEVGCSRDAVRFVHKRNSCDCLKVIYDELKKTTQRTNKCDVCRVARHHKEIKSCSKCNVGLYCSRECQMADWPRHKEQCKELRKLIRLDMKKE